jgi:Flp pilus assembly protein TadG
MSAWADRRGTTAIEFALVAPLLLLIMAGAADYGRWLWLRASLDHAVAGAARCAAVNPRLCGGRAEIIGHARAAAAGTRGARFVVRDAPCGIEVRGLLRYKALLPLPLTIRARACA